MSQNWIWEWKVKVSLLAYSSSPALQIVLSITAQPQQVFAILKPLIKSVNLLPFFFIMHDQRGVPGGPSTHLCHMLDPVVSDGVLMEASQ